MMAWSHIPMCALLTSGATYERELSLPLLGKQTVWMRIESPTEATLKMSGALSHEDRVRYKAFRNGSFAFELGDDMQRLLSRVRTTVGEARYDPVKDEASITVHPPLVGRRVVVMTRSL